MNMEDGSIRMRLDRGFGTSIGLALEFTYISLIPLDVSKTLERISVIDISSIDSALEKLIWCFELS